MCVYMYVSGEGACRRRRRCRNHPPRMLCSSPAPPTLIDSGLVREGHTARRCRRVTYPETYITKYATFSKLNAVQG